MASSRPRRRTRASHMLPSSTSSGSESELPSLHVAERKPQLEKSDLLVPFFHFESEVLALGRENVKWRLPFALVCNWKFLVEERGFYPSQRMSKGALNKRWTTSINEAKAWILATHSRYISFCVINCQGYTLCIARLNMEDKYLFLDSSETFVCLRIGSNTTRDNVMSLLKSFPNLNSGSMYFTRKGPIQLSDLYDLPNLTTVRITKVSPVTWICCYHCTPNEEHRVTVNGSNSDSLHELKQRFLAADSSGLGMQGNGSSSEIWFVHRDEVLTDKILQKMISTSFDWPKLADIKLPLFGFEDVGCVYISHHKCAEDSVLKLFVYTKPADAVAKRLSLKKAPEHLKQCNTTVVLSPDVTHEQLRLEVSKVLQQKPGALQIRIGKIMLEDVKDLQKELSSCNTDISIRIRSYRDLIFNITHQPSHVVDRKVLQFHPFDTVLEVKSKLSTSLHIPKYKIDLTYQGQILTEEQSIHSCQIQTETEIDAIVHESRVLLKIYVFGRAKSHVDVLVDDIESSTIRDLKQFIKAFESDYSFLLDTEILAIFQNQALRDADTLLEAGVRPDMDPQEILMKRCDSLCFSANSTAEDGTFFTFQDDGYGTFTHLLTMTNGKRLFTANTEGTEDDRMQLLSTRKGMTSIHVFTGIKLLSRVLSDDHADMMRRPHASLKNKPAPRVTVHGRGLAVKSVGSATRTVSSQTRGVRKASESEDVFETPQKSEAATGQKNPLPGKSRKQSPPTDSDRETPHSTPGSFKATGCYDIANYFLNSPRDPLDSDDTSCQTQANVSGGNPSSTPPGRPNELPSQPRATDTETDASRYALDSIETSIKVDAGPSCSSEERATSGGREDASQSQAADSERKALQTAAVSREPQPGASREQSVGDSANGCGLPHSLDGVLALSPTSPTHPGSAARRRAVRTTVIEDSVEESESEQGMWELKRKTSTTYLISEKEARHAQMTQRIHDALTVEPCHAALAPLQITHEEEAMWSNAKFKYIDKKIIFAVAKGLGRSGTPVIMQLGVSDEKLHELELRHGMCSSTCHLECLILWCKQEGKEANAEKLKQTLAYNDRKDLVEIVDDILLGKTGYTTS